MKNTCKYLRSFFLVFVVSLIAYVTPTFDTYSVSDPLIEIWTFRPKSTYKMHLKC